MLQADHVSSRLDLIAVLSAIGGPEASRALAKRAIFELSAAGRAAAVQALRSRPARRFALRCWRGCGIPGCQLLNMRRRLWFGWTIVRPWAS